MAKAKCIDCKERYMHWDNTYGLCERCYYKALERSGHLDITTEDDLRDKDEDDLE